jgi:hypothetical protein
VDNAITITMLDSGYYHIRGRGPCNWSQPPHWPCDRETFRAFAFPEASEQFVDEAMRMADDLLANEGVNR